MTLDDIQESIYQGDKVLEKALSLTTDYANKHNLPRVKELVRLATIKRLSVPIAFSNQIATTHRYKNYIKETMLISSTPIIDALRVIDKAEVDANKRILAAKEADTKRNRQFEKNEVMKFLKTNFVHLQSLFELHKMMVNIKREINAIK